MLCYSCHSGGLGATTDVWSGMLLTSPGNRPLKGGGFDTVTMNPDLAGSVTLPVTSSHMVTGGSNTVWGYGAISGSANPGVTGVTLTCTNCHNPHGGAGPNHAPTYRILKGDPGNSTPLFDNGTVSQAATVAVADEYTKNYSISSANSFANVSYPDLYFDQHGNAYAALTDWCAQCHTRDKVEMSAYPGSTDSGDAIFAFRHGSNLSNGGDCNSCHQLHGPWTAPFPGCISCHVAHGTGIRAVGFAGTVPWPDGAASPDGNGRSALLRMDNRGVCEGCHNK